MLMGFPTTSKLASQLDFFLSFVDSKTSITRVNWIFTFSNDKTLMFSNSDHQLHARMLFRCMFGKELLTTVLKCIFTYFSTISIHAILYLLGFLGKLFEIT